MTDILHATVTPDLAGARLDQAAAELFPDYSRARLQQWIKQGALRVDGRQAKVRAKVSGGEQLQLEAQSEPQGEWQPQDLPLDVVFEDEQLLIIDKPAGLVVHPAAGNADGTLLNALLHYLPTQANLPRGGIVHRLDKETTGLLVVAKTLKSHQSLIGQLQARTVGREYAALVQGETIAGGVIDAPIGRHPKNRKKMAVVKHGGKEAVTRYWVTEKFPVYSLLRLKLETGRTHQIRVHMAYRGYPLVGDPVYGGRLKVPKVAPANLLVKLRGFGRQALHASRLQLIHPGSGEQLCWESPMPEDLSHLLSALRDFATRRQGS